MLARGLAADQSEKAAQDLDTLGAKLEETVDQYKM